MAETATLWLWLFLWGDRLGVVVLLWGIGGVVLFDVVQKHSLLLTIPGGPQALVGAIAVNDVEAALVILLVLEGPFLGVCGPDGIYYGGKGVLACVVEGAEEGRCSRVNGGVGRVAEDGM